MKTYWKDYRGNDETFWEHEWSKHGTCISTLDTDCYTNYVPQQEVVDFFNTAISLFKTLPTYEILLAAGVVPDNRKTYTLAQIQEPLIATHGAPVTLHCSRGALDEVWYHFDVRGSVQTGQFVAAAPDGAKGDCPSTGISYLPKTASPTTGSATSTATSTRNGIPSPTGAPFEGKGLLEVSHNGKQTGCLISRGQWYTSGTCAKFRSQADIVEADEQTHLFTLTSSKGPCGIIDGIFECSKYLTKQSIFSRTDDGKLSFHNRTTFSATGVPRKYEKVFVYTDKAEDGDVELEVIWSPSN